MHTTLTLQDDPKPADLVSAISESPDRRTAIVTFVLAIALYCVLRLVYPCLTLSDLNKAESGLDRAFRTAVDNGCLYGRELELVELTRFRVKKTASQIRFQSLQNPPSIWEDYLGLHVRLMPDIIRWYATAEKLRRDILILVEHDKQHHCDTEISRREKVYAAAQIPTASTSATAMMSMNPPSANQTRVGARHRHRRPNAFPNVQGTTTSSQPVQGSE
ncbi:hypothetical protein Moror_8230 [Moniliophthora roreri MCA 2997]|uniref:Uncharacterized protein n=2 Tax=Moniliophthora roreri TaxID=221103 RepID=V2XKQ3_MONRO|nr:hypothetical protein Moror_8230 [Moniliophthora roreri MCA 2997]KAI3606392.1 hypothetical protein WG66_009611 [Moniliophthora roreri]